MTTNGSPRPNVSNALVPKLEAWEWQQQGNCLTVNPEIFFLDGGERMGNKAKKEAKAKAVCVGCPVIAECLAHALSVPEYYGVWGGTTPEERQLLRRKLNRNKLIITQSTNNTDKEN